MCFRKNSIFIFSLMIMACQPNELKVTILETKEVGEIPSASGIVKTDSHIYLIGDDSPYLFKMDENLNLLTRTPIHATKDLIGETIFKHLKPDFEALELVGPNEVIVFGSGSKSPERDYFVKIELSESPEVKTYNIAPFYDNLKQLEALQNHELNIEAAALHDTNLYLFNRRKNLIFVFNYNDFTQYIEGQIPFPAPKVVEVSLPRINGIEAGFSGATATRQAPNLIFTASVENTNNAYDDGEILGSFIGLVDISKIEDPASYRFTLLEDGDIPLKIESVAIQNERSYKEADLLLTTDSDGDKSLVLKCRFSW